MTKVPRLLLAGVVATGLLVGCSGGRLQDESRGAPDPPPNVVSTPGTSVGSGAGSGAGVEDRSGAAFVEQTVSLPGVPEDELTIGIQSLAVEGETMVLRLVVTPDLASVSDDEVVSLGDVMDLGVEVFGASLRLLDRENLKEYSVIHDRNDWWASGANEVETTNGEPMYVFAVFAAPEDDIESIDVRISEQWPELTAVPIVR